LVAADDTAGDVDLKMIAVVVRADQPELFNIIRTLYHAYTEANDSIELDASPSVWEQVEKFDLDVSFWEMVQRTVGYTDEPPSLKKLLIRLFVTDYSFHLKRELAVSLVQFVLPASGRANTVVFLAQWRDSTTKASSYDRLSAEVADLVHLEEHIDGLDINEL